MGTTTQASTDFVIDETSIHQENQLVVRQATELQITSHESFVAAGELRKSLNARLKAVVDFFKPIKQKLDETKKAVLDREKLAKQPLESMIEKIDQQLTTWNNEQEQKRLQQEKQLNDTAKLDAAVDAESNGDAQQAEQILNGESHVPPVVVRPQTPKVDGLSFRKVWKYRITDPNLIPREYLSPDPIKIGGVVKAMKGQVSIPGVEIYQEDDVASRRT